MTLRDIPQPEEKLSPFFKLTPNLATRTVLSVVLTTMGMYYLAAGKKNNDPGKMVWGALLALAGLFVFL